MCELTNEEKQEQLFDCLSRLDNIKNAQKTINNYDTFHSFFKQNYEFLKPKKIYIGTWNGWNFKKDYTNLFDLSIQSLIKMQYIDIKYGEFAIDETITNIQLTE